MNLLGYNESLFACKQNTVSMFESELIMSHYDLKQLSVYIINDSVLVRSG